MLSLKNSLLPFGTEDRFISVTCQKCKNECRNTNLPQSETRATPNFSHLANQMISLANPLLHCGTEDRFISVTCLKCTNKRSSTNLLRSETRAIQNFSHLANLMLSLKNFLLHFRTEHRFITVTC